MSIPLKHQAQHALVYTTDYQTRLTGLIRLLGHSRLSGYVLLNMIKRHTVQFIQFYLYEYCFYALCPVTTGLGCWAMFGDVARSGYLRYHLFFFQMSAFFRVWVVSIWSNLNVLEISLLIDPRQGTKLLLAYVHKLDHTLSKHLRCPISVV